MKRSIAVIAGGFGLLLALAGVSLAHAQSFMSTTSANQVVNGSLYSTGREVDIQGVINGDVYCAGQNIVVDATVDGDVLCAGQNITISGHVDGSVRAVGLDITMNAAVGHSASLAAQNVTVGPIASIGQDFTAGGSKAVIHGAIGRDASLASKNTQLYATIGRNAVLNGTTVVLQNGAHIHGSLTYTSVDKLQKATNARVDGTVKHNTPPVNKRNHIGVLGIFSLLAFPMLLLFAMLTVLCFPRLIHDIAEIPSEKRLLSTVLVGIGTMFVLPIALFLLVLSAVGVVTALFIVLVWVAAAFLSVPITAYYVGRKVLRKSTNSLIVMLTGSLIMLLLYLLPEIGIVFAIFSYVIGMGALITYVKRHLRKPNYHIVHHR